MNLNKLSNKTLIRFLSELRGLMEYYLERNQNVEYETALKLYDEAMEEFHHRTESLNDFQRLKY